MIKAEIVADSINQQRDRLTSLLITFPRIILAEINTHRMLSKNTSSSRAIPFNKMVEAIETNPFIPIAWQKHHSGMQGAEYFTKVEDIEWNTRKWLTARDNAINSAKWLNAGFPDDESGIGVTKQLCNRLLEPFMWTTMLITGSKEGWDNFFSLRCPAYEFNGNVYKSKKDVIESVHKPFRFKVSESEFIEYKDVFSDKRFWQKINKGQAEIHIMDLAEKIYDAMNASIPRQLKAEEWHIPFEDKIQLSYTDYDSNGIITSKGINKKVKISTAMAARVSYTSVGDEKEVDYEKMIKLHDRLIEMRHDSPLEHCARAMSNEEYETFIRGNGIPDYNLGISSSNPVLTFRENEKGWCRNFKGFVQYRHIIEK